jgi:hypothetical protein
VSQRGYRWVGHTAELELHIDASTGAVEDLELTADGPVATLRGRRGDPRHLVKGVSLHGLALRPAGEGFEASIVLDV